MSAELGGKCDAASLSLALAEAGVPGAAAIAGVRRRPVNLQGTSALLVRLALTFEHDRRGEMPGTLVLKTTSTNPGAAAFAIEGGHYRREVRFYREVAPATTSPLPRCYASGLAGDGATGFHLLLEDCLPGRRQYASPLGLDHLSLAAAVDWLAGFHAQWIAAPAAIAGFAAEGPVWEAPDEGRAAGFLAIAEGYLSAGERRLFGEALDAWSSLGELVEGPATLRHGDYHPLNLFFGGDGAPLVVDWQFCEVGSGTMDLVDLLCLHCHPQDRRQLGESLVRRYWEGLRRGGVDGYAWEACWRDFRADVARALLKPAFLCSIPSLPSWAAISRFKQAALAFEDLDCWRLLPARRRCVAA